MSSTLGAWEPRRWSEQAELSDLFEPWELTGPWDLKGLWELTGPWELIEAKRYRTALAGGMRELYWTSPCDLSSDFFREELGSQGFYCSAASILRKHFTTISEFGAMECSSGFLRLENRSFGW